MTIWKEYKLSDFAEINPKIALKKGVEYSFVEMKDLSEGNKFVTPSQKKELKGGSRFENGDTLFARITPCLQNGKICEVKELENGKGFGSTEFLVFRGKKGISDTNFVHYLSLSDEVRSFAEQNMVGTSGRQRVSWQAFENLVLSLPDLPTQTAIAEILSSLDDKIELNNKINQELENLAQTLFKQWFIDFEFPNQNGDPYKSSGGEMIDSELGEIPKGWEVATIDDITEVVTKGTTPTTIGGKFTEFGINFIKVESLTAQGAFIKSKFGYIDEDTNKLLKRSIIKEGDVLFSIAGTIGRVAVVTNDILPANTNQAIAIIRPNKVDSNFLKLLMQSALIQNDTKSNVVQAVQANLSLGIIKATKFIHPTSDILNLFKTTLIDVFNEINILTEENQELTNLRDTLLPKLISGELEVKKT
jgi:type I restriction enzyme S subunit